MSRLISYVTGANRWEIYVLLLCLLGYLLTLSSRRRRVAVIVLVNLAFLETLLQITNGFYPLFRPASLEDKVEHLWLESRDWYNGLSRFYIYQPKPGAMTYGHPFHVNHYGFRGKEFLDRKSEGDDTFRIMVIGDSFTAGIGVAEEDRYTEALGRKLSQKYPDVKFEVVNLGIQGFATVQEYKVLKRMWPIVQPDITIVGFCGNDPDITYNPYYPFTLPVEGRSRALLEKLITFRIIEQWLYGPIARKVAHVPNYEEEHFAAHQPDSPDWVIFERSVKEIGEFVYNETGKPPMVINLLDVSAFQGAMTVAEWKKEKYYWMVRNAFKKAGFILVELQDQFVYQPVSRFELHPNEMTHAYYADALFNTIVDLDIVPSWQKSPHRHTKSLRRSPT